MNCKTCEYPLWNIAARQCPECGAPFKPSDFEFALNAVRFCCPHCSQAYYGTGTKGQLVPRAFDCVSCGRAVDMDEMVLLPTAGVRDAETKGDEMPWLERARTGRIKAWFSTIGRAMSNPGILVSLVPDERPVGEGLRFAVATLCLFFLTNMGLFCLSGSLSGALGLAQVGGAAGYIGMFVAAAVSLAILALGAIVLWAALAHATLLLLGGATARFPQTLHAFCYSTSTAILTAIPIFGFLLYPLWGIWWAVTAAIMLMRVHQCRAWKSFVATIVPYCAIVIGCIVFAAALSTARASASAASAAQARAARAAQLATPDEDAARIVAALEEYRASHGAYPAHASQLWTQGSLLPGQFFREGGRNSVLAGGLTLGGADAMNGESQLHWSEQLAGAMGKRTLAHRVGDCVFTYHGVDPNSADPRLWLVVLPGASNAGISVGLADGSVQVYTRAQWTQKLVDQNVVRAAAGLAPLANPEEITDAQVSGVK